MVSCPRCQRTFDDAVRFCPVDGARVASSAAPTAADPYIGTVLLDQFEVRDVAGRGAMGTVYRAFQRTTDRVVAVKILRRELGREPEVVRRFLREARAVAKLAHPNIVTVYLVGETPDHVPFIAMEYVDGVPLEAICEAQGVLPLSRIVHLTKQILSALGEAHVAGIVHRDLKPANILVTDRSRVPDLVKVLDFGIAKLLHSADQSIATRDGVVFGTPQYIAPEQATGSVFDGRADLYAVGVMLFRMATGQLPFDGEQSMQVVLKHLREPPPRPRSINPQLPVALENIILGLLEKLPDDRPSDADAVIAALDRIEVPPHETMVGVPKLNRAPAPVVVRSTSLTPPPPPQPKHRRGVKPVAGPSATAELVLANKAWWARSSVFGGAVAAIVVGGGIGVGVALWHEPEPPAPVPVPVVAQPTPSIPASTPPLLTDEHVLTEGTITVRAGMDSPPVSGQETHLDVDLRDRVDGPIDPVSLDITVDAPARGEAGQATRADQTHVSLPPAGLGHFRGPFTFGRPGRHKLRVSAQPRGKTALVLVFDVDVAPPPAKPDPRPVKRPKRNTDDDMPMTVISSSSATPTQVIATPARPVEPKAPVAPTPTPLPPSADPTVPTVIEPARPSRHPDPSSDPTTLPPPEATGQ